VCVCKEHISVLCLDWIVSILLNSAFVFICVLECMLIIFIQGVPYILTWLLPVAELCFKSQEVKRGWVNWIIKNLSKFVLADL